MATHTPRSLLWLLAHGSHQFGLIELLASMPAGDVDHEAEALLLAQVRTAWERGWQPIELHRQGYRGASTKVAGKLVALAIAVDHASRRRDELHPGWWAQVDNLKLPRATGGDGWLTGFMAQQQLDRPSAMRAVVDALHALVLLRSLRPLPFDAAANADPLLAKIRALLAKAESTTFEAEALAFTAKAQELMTKHAVDAAAMGGGGTRSAHAPTVIRVPIDSPYSTAKARLLAVVAHASRCRSIELGGCGLSEVVGMPSDLAAVDLLFTSLLVQAQTALTQAAGSSRAFRSSFLYGFASRISERLREINEGVIKEAESAHGARSCPCCARRQTPSTTSSTSATASSGA